jgi:hypothetical protein
MVHIGNVRGTKFLSAPSYNFLKKTKAEKGHYRAECGSGVQSKYVRFLLSAATPIGNPQNMLIANLGNLSFVYFLAVWPLLVAYLAARVVVKSQLRILLLPSFQSKLWAVLVFQAIYYIAT